MGLTTYKYQIDMPPASVSGREAVGGIEMALQAWSAVAPIEFKLVNASPDLRFRFDGLITRPDNTMLNILTDVVPAGEPIPIGLTSFNQITFNPTFLWANLPSPPAGFLDLGSTALHEVGHFLKLGHSTNLESAMYPDNQGVRSLSADDIEKIQAKMGARPVAVPGWFGDSTSGADVAVVNLGRFDSTLDVLVGQIDNPDGADTAYYRVGYDIDTNGNARGGWSPPVPMGGPLGNDSQGLGLATGFIQDVLLPDGRSSIDMLMMWTDNPPGENQLLYRVGFALSGDGLTATWTGDFSVPGPVGSETAEIACALFDVSGSGSADLIVAWIDNPDGENTIYYKIGFDIAPNGAVSTWSDRMVVPTTVGSSSSGLGICVADTRGNGRPDLLVFWIDNPDGPNNAFVRIGEDLDRDGVPLTGWGALHPIPGSWGNDTSGAGAAFTRLRGGLRPDVVVLTIDAPDGQDAGYLRVLSPPLPTWNLVRPVPNAIHAAKIAAVAMAERAIVLANRGVAGPANAPIQISVWDQTDLNENKGSDILEFAGPAAVNDARADSAITVAARKTDTANVFYVGLDNLIRTSFSNFIAQAGTLAAGPPWFLPGFRPPVGNPVRGNGAVVPPVPSSPLTSTSMHEQHVAVFFAGREDDLEVIAWNESVGWVTGNTRANWQRPIVAISAAPRSGRIYVVVVDGAGALWELSVDDLAGFEQPQRIIPLGFAAGPVALVSRNNDQLDLFWIDKSSRVPTSSFWNTATGLWSPPFSIAGSRIAALGSAIAAVNPWNERLQVFWQEPDRSIWSSWWAPRADGLPTTWSPPAPAVTPGLAAGGCDLVAVSRTSGHVRLFFVDAANFLQNISWGTSP